jgi:hypothetical protein
VEIFGAEAEAVDNHTLAIHIRKVHIRKVHRVHIHKVRIHKALGIKEIKGTTGLQIQIHKINFAHNRNRPDVHVVVVTVISLTSARTKTDSVFSADDLATHSHSADLAVADLGTHKLYGM